jgi:ribulokinase
MAEYLIGIDYGTGGAKAAVVDSSGEVRGFAYEEYPFFHEHPGWSEHDAVNYWKAACRLIPAAVAEARVRASDVRGIALSSALPSMVMVDRNHNPVHRAYNLLDKRATDQVAWIRTHIGEERQYQLSGYPIDDHPNLVNLLWEKHNRPEDYKRIHKILTIDGFIALKLTGRATVHFSGAAFFGVAYDLRNRRFDRQMLADLGIEPTLMPVLCECTDIIGEVTAAAAEATGLIPGIPVAGGQVDCNASWVGAGAIEPGDIQCNLGTVGNFGIVHRDGEFGFTEIGKLLMTFPYTTNPPDTFVTVPTTLTGGQTIRFVRDVLSQAEVQAEKSLGVSAYDLLNLQAENVPPGSEGLVALPFLMGERSPLWDADARGVLFGLSLNHTKGHVVRAMMEGVAYALYHNFQLVQQAGIKINYPMVLNEGGAVSRLWRRIITDVLGIPTVMVKGRAGAPYGDAILAGVATGVFKDFAVAKELVEYVDPMDPDEDAHERYAEYFALYRRLYGAVKGEFKELARLRNKY